MKVAPSRAHLFLLQPVWDHLKPSPRFEVFWTTQSCHSLGELIHCWLTLILSCVAFEVLLREVGLDTLRGPALTPVPLSLHCCEKESRKFQNCQMTSVQRWFLCLFLSGFLSSL